MDPFASLNRVPGSFDHMPLEMQAKEAARTRRAVADLLDRPRAEFPAIEVRFGNRTVPAHVVDSAFVGARMAHRAAGRPVFFDWLAAMAAEMPAAIEAERVRKAMMLPLPIHSFDAARKAGEAARCDVPKELAAPLILDAMEALTDAD